MEFYVKIRVPPQELYETLRMAFYEGGINSWGAIMPWDSLRASGITSEARREKLNDLARLLNVSGHLTSAILPMCDGQWVLINEEGKKTPQTFEPSHLQNGLDILAERHQDVLNRIINGQADASDASTLIECGLFGKIKYA